MKKLREVLGEASVRPYKAKGAIEVGDTTSDFARGAYNSATMDLGKYARAGVDYGIKNLGAAVGIGKGTTYGKELEQEKQKDTIAQTRSPDAYKYGGYTADAASAATGLGGIAKLGVKTAVKQLPRLIGTQGEKLLGKESGERLLGAKLSGWMKKDQDLIGKSRDSLQGEIKKFFPDNPTGAKRLERAIGDSAQSKHDTWGLAQHMEKEPQFQQRVIDQLRKNDPTDKRATFLQDRKNVNDYLRKNYPDKFDDIRNANKKYDPSTGGYRQRVETDPLPGFGAKKASQSRAELRPGGVSEDPYLRKAIVDTKAKTQPSFGTSWSDVKTKDKLGQTLDRINQVSNLKAIGQTAAGVPAVTNALSGNQRMQIDPETGRPLINIYGKPKEN